MTEQKDEQISKRVEWKAADDERQVATGVVMVPDKVDLQGDYVRPETIRDFAEDYMARLPQGEAAQGVMHAVWPDEHITLVENTVLDAPREIGGEEIPAGSWIQSFKFDDNELWTLVRDDILSGYSIGAESVAWSDPMEQEELPDDVDVAADYPDDHLAWELQDGTVVENSAVDIPAVPDAEILATKDASEKRVADLIGDKEQFVEEMAERGHSEGEAERLWNYLRRAVDETDVDVEDTEASASFFQRVGKAAVNAFTGGDGADFDDEEKDAPTDKDAPGGDTSDTDKNEMSDTDDSLEEKVEALEKRIDELDEQTDKNDEGGDADDDTKAVEEQLDTLEEKLDDLAKASGQSQQLDGGDDEDKSASKADVLGIPRGDA